MKAITFLCFWLSLPLSIQAQAILEHTYPTTDLHRVHWTLGGEHYWYSDDSLKHIKVYSATHQLEKTIRYPSVLNSQVRLLKSEHAVTQTHINGDNLLEMLWYINDTVSKKEQLQIRNERDTLLFSVPTRPYLVYFSEIEGLPTKLLIATNENGLKTTIYNVPNIRLDTAYLGAYYLRRKKFGYAGEKYFYMTNDSMRFFNADHSPWKQIKLKWSLNIQLVNSDPYTDADDNVFSKDSLVEVVFRYDVTGNYGHMVINELGQKIYKTNNDFRLDHQKGLMDRLFIDTTYSNANSDYHYFRIYNLPSFQKELRTVKTSYPWQRTLLKKYGETFFTYDGNLLLYFTNSTPKKTINLHSNSLFYQPKIFMQNDVPIVSDSIISRDPLIEVIYTEFNYYDTAYAYTTKIINEKGFIYNTIDSTKYFAINQSPTLSPKLITKTGNDKPYDTKVWRFNTTTPTKEAPSVLEAKIYPNPFSKSITIETQENTVFPLKIRLINALGEVVFATKTDQSKTDLALPDLSKGVYFLELTDENKRTVREIVKMD